MRKRNGAERVDVAAGQPVARDLMMTTEEAAVILGKSASTLARWRGAGKGPRYRRIGGTIAYTRSDLDAFVMNTPVEVGP